MDDDNKKVFSLKEHLVCATAMLTEATPVFSYLETRFGEMSITASVNARFIAAGLTFTVLGYGFEKGRTLSLKACKLYNTKKEKRIITHDIAYSAIFSTIISPPIYALSQYFAGEAIDTTQIIQATKAATVIGAFNGIPTGYLIDVFKDLSGITECKRKSYPSLLKTQTQKTKRTLLAGCVAASIGITGLMYATSQKDDVSQPNEQTQVQYSTLEQKAN